MAAVALLSILAAPFSDRAEADQSPDPSALVFTHGVASGDVTPASAVLWTPVDRQADLIAEVAEDEAFGRIVVGRSASADAGKDFAVVALVAPLEPGRTYHYRFRRGRTLSEGGTFRTAPRPDHPSDVRFTFTGDTARCRTTLGSLTEALDCRT
jgi:phosphodiesterase/alkaline phosphatase D-like protein